MKFVLLLIFFLSQVNETKAVIHANPQKAIADSIYDIADTYYEQGFTARAIVYLQEALPIYTDLGDSTLRSDVLNDLGVFHLDLGNIDQSIEYFKMALLTDRHQRDTVRMIGRIKNVGIAHQTKGFYKIALDYYYEALQMANSIEREKSIASISNSIALLLQEQGQYENSMAHHKKALKNWKSAKAIQKIPYSYHNIGELHERMQQYDSALFYYQRALTSKEDSHSEASRAVTLHNMGNVHLKLDNLERAREYLLEALRIQKLADNKEELATLYNSIGEWHLANKNWAQASLYLDSGQLLIEKSNIRPAKLKNLSLRIRLLENQDQFTQAYHILEQWAALRDSLFNEERVAVLKTQSEFELNQAIQGKKLARQQTVLAQTEQKQQRLIIIFLSLATLIVFTGGFIIWKNRLKIRQQNAQLQQKNRLIEIQKSDIRHRTQNVLERVIYVLQLVSNEVEDEEQKFQIKRGENMIFALSNLEETLYELEDEEQVPVAFFFNKLLNELLESHTLPAKFKLAIDQSLVLPIEVVIPLALITAELVTNAIKHAFSNVNDPTLWIGVQFQDHRLHLSIRDNGVGFSKEVIAKGFGQRLIQRLVKHLDGIMTIPLDRVLNSVLFFQ